MRPARVRRVRKAASALPAAASALPASSSARITLLLLIALAAAVTPADLVAQVRSDASVQIELEGRLMPGDPVGPKQNRNSASVAVRPELELDWAGGDQLFTFEGFLRLDAADSRRTHMDLRVLSWELIRPSWELRLGLRRVFWGVTESQHLVDIINQTDLVENPDGEDKLGQPMLNLALIRSWGTVDVFLMPFFRERTFPGADGRLRLQPPVVTGRAEFENGAGSGHLDWAVRWFHTVGIWDIGVSHFHGTGREPTFRPELGPEGPTALIPVYAVLDQTSLDVQATMSAWLWKLEAATRSGPAGRHAAFTGGFEYTLGTAFGTPADLGLLAEYSWDSRGRDATSLFQNDVFLGTRLALNDVQSTQLLAGGIVDLDTGSLRLSLEASRRLADDWSMELEVRLFGGASPDEPLWAFRRDDYLQLSLVRYF